MVEGWLQSTSEKIRHGKDELLSRTDELITHTQTQWTANVAPQIKQSLLRQQVLSRKLKESLSLNSKILILVFLIFGFQKYRDTEAPDISLMFFIVAFLAYLIQRISSAATPPQLYYKKSEWLDKLLEQCPHITQSYKPPRLWGWNGHIQTVILGKMGRSINPILPYNRHSFVVSDGATVYYDVFEHPFCVAKATLIIIPGIANTSEKLYIKTFVRYALTASFRVVVLNHLGALKGYTITSPRIFGYGHTDEVSTLVNIIETKFQEPMILIGFSMGANVITKYLCENPYRQHKFLGAVSVCQGYDIAKTDQYLLGWHRFARLYNWAITNGALKNTINSQGKVLFNSYDQVEISKASCIQDVDTLIMKKMYNFDSVEEMYEAWSCSKYIDKISLPTMFLNALDDPIVAPHVLDIPVQVNEIVFSAGRETFIYDSNIYMSL